MAEEPMFRQEWINAATDRRRRIMDAMTPRLFATIAGLLFCVILLIAWLAREPMIVLLAALVWFGPQLWIRSRKRS